jgi:peptide/nickel transport system permease protein
MGGLLLRRLLTSIPTLLVVCLISFGLIYLIPGDPSVDLAGPDASPEDVAATRERLGLNLPFLTRTADWFGGLFRGDLGTSLYTGRSVTDSLMTRLPVTLSLALVALIITIVVGIAVGIWAGTRPGGWVDRLITFFTTFGISVPDFWVGLMLVIFLALKLDWFPAVGYTPFAESPWEWLHHLILPGFTLAIPAIAEFGRQLRASVISVSAENYIRTARSRGLSETRINMSHVLKNALTAPLTVLGAQGAHMLGGAVIIEVVFGLPGIGNYAVESVLRNDFPTVQAIVLLTGVIVVLVNLAIDVLQAVLNPKLRTAAR